MFSTATEFDLNHLLTNDIWPEDQCISPACLTQDSAKKLIERIDAVPIFAHTYPFYFNFHFKTIHPRDVLDFAYINEDNFGLPYDHGTPFRRAVEEKLIAPGQSIQVGMRGSLYSRDHYKKSEKLGLKIIPMAEVRQIGIERTIKIESEYRNFV